MNVLKDFSTVKAFAFDIDGVLTNGSLLIYDDGQMVRQMNIKDGYALQLAIQKGFKIVVISGGNSEAVKNRLEKLGIADIFLRVKNKKTVLQEWALANDILLEHVLYMGDDVPDVEPLQIVGVSTCPNDAATEVKALSKYVSSYKVGDGCVRDVIEKVLRLNNAWE